MKPHSRGKASDWEAAVSPKALPSCVGLLTLRYFFAAFFRFLPCCFCHSFSRQSISALGPAITARNRLSIFWKGVEPGTSIGGLAGFMELQRRFQGRFGGIRLGDVEHFWASTPSPLFDRDRSSACGMLYRKNEIRHSSTPRPRPGHMYCIWTREAYAMSPTKVSGALCDVDRVLN